MVKLNLQGDEQNRCDVSSCFENINHMNDEYLAETFCGDYEIKELAGILFRQDGSSIIGIGEKAQLQPPILMNSENL